MKVARRLTVLVVTLALFALCSLELAYRLTIASIAPPPGLETGAPLSPRLACAVWAAETGGGPRPIPRLYPWTVHRYVADHDLAFVPAWGVARTWLATAQERGQVRGMMQWHFKGIAATAWVTRNLPQEEIMRRYADKLWAGGPEVGLEAGARYWYQAAATSLDDAQLALLLAVAASPSHYDPLAHPERALERRNVVLTRFFQAGCIPGSSLAAAQAAPLALAPPRS